MHHRYRYLFGFFVLTAALAAPTAIRAAAKPQDNGRQAERQDDKDQNRVYDRSHKDYHKLGWQRRPFLPSVPRR